MPARRPFQLIGELMNSSFARARRAWIARDLSAYQALARLESELGADYLTLNIDGTQSVAVKFEEMLAFLPDLVPAVQQATSAPISFDNPDVRFHRAALKHYDRSKSPAPILNSVAASREHLDEMIELAAEYDTLVIVMASEKFGNNGGSARCTSAEDVHEVAKQFTEMLAGKAGRRRDQIIIDPGLAPVAADTYGIINVGLDAMRLIRQDPDLEGVHLLVGLTNFSFGTPRHIRIALENAFLTLGLEAGLDFILGNPEKHLHPLKASDAALRIVREALAAGRTKEGEPKDEAGFRQAEKIMELY